MVTRRNPRRASCRTTTSRIGYSPIGISGFGRTTVYGRNRVSIPPARITARSHIVEVALITCQILGAQKPIDGRRQALAERRRRLKSSRLPQFCIIATQTADLTLAGTQPLGIGDRRGFRPHQLGNELEQAAHAYLAIRTDLKYLPGSPFHTRDRQKTLACVLDEGEIPGRLQIAHPDLTRLRSHLRNDGWDDGPRRLARTVGIERTGDHHRNVKRIVEAQRHGIGAYFRCAVW